MSEGKAATGTSGSDTVAFLASVPLFDGMTGIELEELAGVMRRRNVQAGSVLWRESEDADSLLVIVSGRVEISLVLPGDRAVQLTTVGPGQILGEIPLLGGGKHTATARAIEAVTLLALGRADFAGLVSRRHPTAFALKRRIAGIACERLRTQLATLAASLAGDSAGALAEAGPPAAELEPCGPPNSAYVRRLGAFHAFDSLALWGFLTAGRFARCPAGRTLLSEGVASDACYLTINGAVEQVIVRGGGRIRVGLAGPGHAFGYESLIDGGPSPATAITRERVLLLVLPQHAFERLFNGEETDSHVFLDVINRELMTSLRQALRPHARFAASL
jgi:CRP-like cAMP-binding protein